jgi:hypothetical protein
LSCLSLSGQIINPKVLSSSCETTAAKLGLTSSTHW